MAIGSGVTQGHDFGVWATGALRVTLAEDVALWVGDDAADSGIG
jgi:hypothetical protein